MDKTVNWVPAELPAAETPGKRKGITLFSVLAGVFLVGMVYGAVIVSTSTTSMSRLETLAGQFLLQKESAAFGRDLWLSACSGGAFLWLLFLLGFSAVGQPFSIFLLFFRGLGWGSVMGYFYVTEGLRGVWMVLVLLVPTGLLSSYGILLAGRESIKLSNLFFRTMIHSGGSMPEGCLKRYGVRFLVLTALILGSAVISGISSLVFSMIFS